MKTLIATTDFSGASLNALHYAADMATATKAELYIFHVLKVYTLSPEVPWPPDSFVNIESEADIELAKLKTLLTTYTRNQVNVHTRLEIGGFKEKLEELCNDVKPFAIVMGPTGDPLKRFLAGSATLQAVTLHLPVMIIPASAKFHGLKRIAVACDLEHPGNLPRDFLVELHRLFNAEISFLYVNKKAWPLEQLEKLKEEFKTIDPKFLFIQEDTVEEGVHKFLDKNEVDLLLLLPKKHAFPFDMFRKRHSKNILLHESFPIMTVHE